ncbi:MAG: amidase [Alcaligenaceae bacterium]|nr:amidase [Alcaligenaceae bacterium]
MTHSSDGFLSHLSERLSDDSKGGLANNDIKDILSSVEQLKNFMSSQRKLLVPFATIEDFTDVLVANSAPLIPNAQSCSDPVKSADHKNMIDSPKQAVESALKRITSSPRKNLLWMSIFETEAQQCAQLLDEKEKQQRGVLYGYTIGLKDMVSNVGHVSGWGAKSPAIEKAATEDAEIVKKLKKADAVILGTLHMAEFALSPTGLNEWHGLGRSPINDNYISGGSSSGSGMAVAAGHVTATIGSDTGGSIRLPAACCSAVGLKATQGLISVKGVMPLSPSLDCIGPIARSVTDCANVFFALTANNSSDCLIGEALLENTDPADCIVSIPAFVESNNLSITMLQALNDVEQELRSMGVKVIEVPMPDLERSGLLSSVVLSVEATSYHQQRLQESPELYGRQVLRRLSRGFGLSGIDYYDALRLRGPVLEEFLKNNLQGAHALLLPTMPDMPLLVSQTVDREQAVLEKEFSALSWWTRGINFLGVPAISIPVSQSKEGLPLSIQLVGAPYGEMNILRLARLLEKQLSLTTQENQF